MDEQTREMLLIGELAVQSEPETPESIAEVQAFLEREKRFEDIVVIGHYPRSLASEHFLRQAHAYATAVSSAVDELLETPGATFDTSPRTERVVVRNGYSYPRSSLRGRHK